MISVAMTPDLSVDFQSIADHVTTKSSETKAHVTTKGNETKALVQVETDALDGDLTVKANAINQHTSDELAALSVSPVKSIQRGVFRSSVGAGAYVDIPLSSVDMVKTKVNILHLYDARQEELSIQLVSSTILRVTNHYLGVSLKIALSWEVVEHA